MQPRQSLYNLTKNRNVVGGIIVLTYFLAYFMPSKPQNRGANVPLYNLTKNTNALRQNRGNAARSCVLQYVCQTASSQNSVNVTLISRS